ncbi:MAG: SMP-30/gluconolactonase/LRE family protein [Pseudomonadota bacterium]
MAPSDDPGNPGNSETDSTTASAPVPVLDGLHFGEGPRVRGDWLYFSDMHGHRVQRLNLRRLSDGDAAHAVLETVLELHAPCSGLGWLPNGDLLVVEMEARRLLRYDGQSCTVHAELSGHATFHCNDMVVDEHGRAWVGNFGFDLHGGAEPATAELCRVDPDGSVDVVARDLMFPNGTVITPDGSTLIVAESFANRLTAFQITADGSLAHRALWASLPDGAAPDGICLDAGLGVWVASPTTNECLRIQHSGTVTHRIATDRGAFACMLAETTLYVLTAAASDPDTCARERTGQIVALPAPYPRVGWP